MSALGRIAAAKLSNAVLVVVPVSVEVVYEAGSFVGASNASIGCGA